MKVAFYDDNDFGFLRLTVDKNQKIVIGEYFVVPDVSNPVAARPVLADSFTLRLDNHTID